MANVAMKREMAAPEQKLAAAVIAWLEGFDTHQEVQREPQGPIADIVVDAGGWGWVIECKRSLGLAVLGQARGWQRAGFSWAFPRCLCQWIGRLDGGLCLMI